MGKNFDRKEWLKSGGLITTGVFLNKANVSESAKFPTQTEAQERAISFWEWEKNEVSNKPVAMKARLLANENPYGPSEMTKEAIIKSVVNGNRYGHAEAAQLTEMIAKKEGVTIWIQFFLFKGQSWESSDYKESGTQEFKSQRIRYSLLNK